jgi:SIR2-like domain
MVTEGRMRLTEFLNLPDELLDASLAGELVVFAGAGVSMGAPARLPSFKGLAEQIGRLSHEAMPGASEPLDVYLGRLEQSGVLVREWTRDILYRPRGHANPLHNSLINIFGPVSPIRIVTTNFDLLFERAARAVGRAVEVFDAPALPLGDNFEGIVHLHGSFGKQDLSRLVLTDRDFGAAYITEGWAARFLVRAFIKFKVMFVGYSLGDPVLRYLAAALPPGTKRYAIVSDDTNRDDWAARQIELITYPRTNDHRHLVTGIAKWATQVHTGFLEHEQQLRQIAEAGPPNAPWDIDYLLRALRQERTAGFFVQYARGESWLTWVAEQGLLDRIFDPTATLAGGDRQLLWWYGNHFAIDYARDALQLLQQHHSRMHPELWQLIAVRLQMADGVISPNVMSSWITALEGGLFYPQSAEMLTPILRLPESHLTVQQALRLFIFLTRPRSTLEASVSWAATEGAGLAVRGSDALLGDRYWLNEGWKALGQRIGALADFACISLIANFKALTQVSLDAEPENSFDRLSWERSAIEPHEQDSLMPAEGWSVLVDAIRDSLEQAAMTAPEFTTGLINMLIRDQSLLFRRLAIHAMAVAPHVAASNKLLWLLEQVGLYQFGLKHEVFRLLKLAWGGATDEAKDMVVAAAEDGMRATDEASEYEIYNLLYWLSTLTPAHSSSIRAFENVQIAHPNFGPRDHPDFDHWQSFGWGDRLASADTPVVPDDPHEVAQDLIQSSEDDRPQDDRPRLMSAISGRAANDPAWATGLLGELYEASYWDIEAWDSILAALASNRPEDSDVWSSLLTTLLDYPHKHYLTRNVGSLLRQGIESQPPGKIDDSLLPTVLSVITKYWTAVMNANNRPLVETDNWLDQAINSGEGLLLLALLATCSRLWRLAGDDWHGLPEEAKQLMARTTTEHGLAGQLARAVLGSQVAFLDAADQMWTQEVPLPWFALAPSLAEAAATWDGFLAWGRWNERLISLLGRELPELLALVRERIPNRLNRYLEHLAALYVHSTAPFITPAWLDSFFASATSQEAADWTIAVLGQMPGEQSARASIWNSRLRPLADRRLQGIPRPPSPEEIGVMGTWAALGNAVTRPIVDQLVAAGRPALQGNFLINEVLSSEGLHASPTQGVRLLTWLLTGFSEAVWFCDKLAEAATQLHGSGASQRSLRDFCEELARVGCPQAQELRSRLGL